MSLKSITKFAAGQNYKMTSNNNLNNTEEISEEINADESVSIDDFIKELEEKEKDLHISSEMVIEVEESELDETHISAIPNPPVVKEKEKAQAPASPALPQTITPVAETSPEPVDVSKFEKEIAELKTKISKMEAEKSEHLENSVRRQKDFENFKKRTERERGETYHKQLGNLASKMLPVLDNLNRALDSAAELEGEKLKEFQQFFDGIALVNQQLNEVLVEMGVEPIKTVGEEFDPNYHEAVATQETEEFPANTIIEELLRGYKIGETVVRASMVKVATSQSAQTKSTEENAPEAE